MSWYKLCEYHIYRQERECLVDGVEEQGLYNHEPERRQPEREVQCEAQVSTAIQDVEDASNCLQSSDLHVLKEVMEHNC